MKAKEVEIPVLVQPGDRYVPVKGDVYLHNKSLNLYYIEGIANDANNDSSGEIMIIYRSASTGYMYARHIEEFLDNNGEKYRFERLVKASPESEKV
jgi:hypothetical protein